MERDPGALESPPASRTAAGKLARSSPWWIARCPPDCSVARHWPPCGRTLATRRDSCFAACACARGKRCGSDPHFWREASRWPSGWGPLHSSLSPIAPLFADWLVALLDRARLSGLRHRQGSQWQRLVSASGWVALHLTRALPLVMVGNELLGWHRCLMTTFPSGRTTASTASWSTTRARLVTRAMPRQGLSTTPFPRMAVPAEDGAYLPPARELAPPQPTSELPAAPAGPLMAVPTPVPTPVPHPLAVVLEDGCLVLWLVGTAAVPGRWNLRADILVMALADIRTGHAALFGVPRNCVKFPIPQGFATEYPLSRSGQRTLHSRLAVG